MEKRKIMLRIFKFIPLIVLILFLSSAILLGKKIKYNFSKVEVIENYDGDTVKVNIKGVHPLLGDGIKIRVLGIDSPEIRSKLECERKLAIEAKKATSAFLNKYKRISLRDCTRGSFFRLVCDICGGGKDSLGDFLLDKKLAIVWKKNVDHIWCRDSDDF